MKASDIKALMENLNNLTSTRTKRKKINENFADRLAHEFLSSYDNKKLNGGPDMSMHVINDACHEFFYDHVDDISADKPSNSIIIKIGDRFFKIMYINKPYGEPVEIFFKNSTIETKEIFHFDEDGTDVTVSKIIQ